MPKITVRSLIWLTKNIPVYTGTFSNTLMEELKNIGYDSQSNKNRRNCKC